MKEMRGRQRRDAKFGIDPQRRPAFSTALWSAVVLFAAVVLMRRLSGSFALLPTVLTSLTLTASCMLLTGIAHALHFFRQDVKRTAKYRLIAAVLTLLPPAAVGGCLLPLDSPFAVSALAVLFLFSTACVLRLDDAARNSHRGSSSDSDRIVMISGPDTGAKPQASRHDDSSSLAGDSLEANDQHTVVLNPPGEFAGEQVMQWMSRSTSADGATDLIEGIVKTCFAPGEKQAVVHLSFNPPFGTLPELHCETDEDAGVRLRTASVYSYGARIDARRSDAIDEPMEIDVAYTASASIPCEKAA